MATTKPYKSSASTMKDMGLFDYKKKQAKVAKKKFSKSFSTPKKVGTSRMMKAVKKSLK